MELLAPAGNWDSFIAAIKNGADAVYLGGQSYSARQSAGNFDNEALKSALDYAHIRRKKVYVTVNTLIDHTEMPEVIDYLYFLLGAGVDAVILQDIGLVQAIHRILPDLRLHGSTQMTLHNADGVSFWKEQGLKRIVLARECSQKDMAMIHEQVEEEELEVFVHGALCYSYSGQCLFSSMVGGRSGNRGRCAQPCRLPYDLYARGSKAKIAADRGRYVLSPADLCLIDDLSGLQEAGVHSLKIEGRMKRPEYVAIVTAAYRQALDEMEKNAAFKPQAEVKERLLKVFNRNFTSGYFRDEKKDFLSSTRPNNRGVFVGRVLEQNNTFETKIKLSDQINLGDGLAIWVSKGKNPAVTVRELRVEGKNVQQANSGEIISIPLESRVFSQDRVFKTHDEVLLQEAIASIKDETGNRIAVDAEVSVSCGSPLLIQFTDERGNQVLVESQNLVQKANKYPLSEEVLREKLERMGNTEFFLRDLKVQGDSDAMIPFSDINEARREGTEALMQMNLQDYDTEKISRQAFESRKKQVLSAVKSLKTKDVPLLTVTVPSLDHARIAIESGADRVYVGLEGIGTHRRVDPLELIRLNETMKSDGKIVAMMPRINKPSDPFNYRQALEMGSLPLMVGNWGDLKWALDQDRQVMTDSSFNVFNRYSLQFLRDLGSASICLSPELNFTQLQNFDNFDKVELLVHGEMILMESQFCSLEAMLGKGEGKCSGHCMRDEYYIRDEKAYEFPVATDADCRFYVFNSRTLCMIEDLPRLMAFGPGSLRVEARRMEAEELSRTVKLYRKAVDGLAGRKKIELSAYKQQLEQESKSSFTKCHYYRGVM